MRKVQERNRKWIPRAGMRYAALLCLILAAVAPARAQTVDEKLAALEARIQQLEQELGASKGGVTEVKAAEVHSVRPFLRPAVLVSSSPSPGGEPAEVAESTAPLAPPLQAPSTLESRVAAVEQSVTEIKDKTDIEGLSFFKGVRFSGFLDAYYGFNFDEPADRKVPYRNFDFNHNSLTLSQVTFDMSKPVSESSPLGYLLQLEFGPTADWVNSGDFTSGNSTASNFLQYYLSGRLPVGRGLTLDVGKFVTQHGAEVIDTRADWNYSRSLLFAWAIPYYHFGVRATYPASDKLTLAGYVVNGWNNVLENNGAKTYGFQFIWNPSSRFSFLQNYMVGPEQADDSDNYRHLWDTLVTVKLHEKVTFMTNFDYGMDRITGGEHVHWIGTANYLRFQLTDSFALIPRFEFYSDPMGFTTGARQQLKEFTITPEFLINEHMVTRFEYRRDWSNADVFGGDGPFSQDTAAVGLILKF